MKFLLVFVLISVCIASTLKVDELSKLISSFSAANDGDECFTMLAKILGGCELSSTIGLKRLAVLMARCHAQKVLRAKLETCKEIEPLCLVNTSNEIWGRLEYDVGSLCQKIKTRFLAEVDTISFGTLQNYTYSALMVVLDEMTPKTATELVTTTVLDFTDGSLFKRLDSDFEGVRPSILVWHIIICGFFAFISLLPCFNFDPTFIFSCTSANVVVELVVRFGCSQFGYVNRAAIPVERILFVLTVVWGMRRKKVKKEKTEEAFITELQQFVEADRARRKLK